MVRHLPSLKALLCFDHSARHGSVSKAAIDLSLTQSAVSRQIKNLESYLGVTLFHREKQRLQLSAQGQNYLSAIRPLLNSLEEETLKLRTAQIETGALTLAAPPTFMTRVLIPMMAGFQKDHPDIPVNFIAHIGMADFTQQGIDVAIAYGTGHWDDLHSLPLTAEKLIPLCHPDLVTQLPPRPTPLDLRRHTLLHIRSRPHEWRDWFSHHGLDDSATLQGPHFDHFTMALQAALAGLGIALMPNFVARDEIETGRLIAPFQTDHHSTNSYWITCQHSRRHIRKIALFMTWLHANRAALPYYSSPRHLPNSPFAP